MNALDMIPLAFGRPDMVARWAQICREAHDRDEAWIAMLRREGIKAAHPDDGWVDREKNTVCFAYPQFNDGAGVGDKIALGWASGKWRIVTITGRAVERWAFSPNIPQSGTHEVRSL